MLRKVRKGDNISQRFRENDVIFETWPIIEKFIPRGILYRIWEEAPTNCQTHSKITIFVSLFTERVFGMQSLFDPNQFPLSQRKRWAAQLRQSATDAPLRSLVAVFKEAFGEEIWALQSVEAYLAHRASAVPSPLWEEILAPLDHTPLGLAVGEGLATIHPPLVPAQDERWLLLWQQRLGLPTTEAPYRVWNIGGTSEMLPSLPDSCTLQHLCTGLEHYYQLPLTWRDTAAVGYAPALSEAHLQQLQTGLFAQTQANTRALLAQYHHPAAVVWLNLRTVPLWPLKDKELASRVALFFGVDTWENPQQAGVAYWLYTVRMRCPHAILTLQVPEVLLSSEGYDFARQLLLQAYPLSYWGYQEAEGQGWWVGAPQPPKHLPKGLYRLTSLDPDAPAQLIQPDQYGLWLHQADPEYPKLPSLYAPTSESKKVVSVFEAPAPFTPTPKPPDPTTPTAVVWLATDALHLCPYGYFTAILPPGRSLALDSLQPRALQWYKQQYQAYQAAYATAVRQQLAFWMDDSCFEQCFVGENLAYAMQFWAHSLRNSPEAERLKAIADTPYPQADQDFRTLRNRYQTLCKTFEQKGEKESKNEETYQVLQDFFYQTTEALQMLEGYFAFEAFHRWIDLEALPDRISPQTLKAYALAVLTHPEYPNNYATNLRHDLPRLPLMQDFDVWATWGQDWLDMHSPHTLPKPAQLQTSSSQRFNAGAALKLTAQKLQLGQTIVRLPEHWLRPCSYLPSQTWIEALLPTLAQMRQKQEENGLLHYLAQWSTWLEGLQNLEDQRPKWKILT